MNFSLETVRDVAQLLGEARLGEIVVESTNEAAPARLVVRRETIAPVAPPASASGASAQHVAPQPHEPASKHVTVVSPAVGFFRHAAKPVGENSTVRSGQTVGIVESLRVPNEVPAPVAGRVLELLVEDGQGVEFHQPLFIIEPEA